MFNRIKMNKVKSRKRRVKEKEVVIDVPKKLLKKSVGLKKSLLDKYGYKASKKSDDRQRSLSNAVIVFGPDVLMKKLDSLYVKNKELNPDVASIYKTDKEWVKEKYENF